MTNFDWKSFTLEWVWYPQYPALFPISSCSYFFPPFQRQFIFKCGLDFFERGIRRARTFTSIKITKSTIDFENDTVCLLHIPCWHEADAFRFVSPLIFRLISSSRTSLFTECVYFAQRCNSRSVAGCVLPGFFLTHPFIDSLALFGKPSVLILMVFPIFLPCN